MTAAAELKRRDAAPSSPGATLSLRSVTKRFGGVAALSDFSLEVGAGELTGVIGPNGAGKSTLLSLINAAQRPTSGEILLDGNQRLDRLQTYRVSRLGVARAHQIPRPFQRMTVRENLLVGAQNAGRRTGRSGEIVDDVLELCGLADRAQRRAGVLPLLDLKRLEVARALSVQPRLLLLDEVAAGLVEHEVDEITELIAGVHSRGVTIILVEHVQALVQALAQRVVVLDFGKQIAEGTPSAIAEDPEVIRVYLGAGEANSARKSPATAPEARETLLRTERLCVDYGKLRALRDIDFEVGKSEVVAVLGANGAGKTSLARALAGIVPTSSGRIVFGGDDITATPAFKRARQGISICHEGRRLFAGMTVRENLDLATYSNAAGEHKEELLARVYQLFPLLEQRAGSLAGELSGGQQQMVAIARALMSEPRLVIFDELSLGLAPRVIDEIYEAIEEIRSWGISIVLIEQSAYRALAIADRAYVFGRGKVSYVGSPAALSDSQALRAAYFGGGSVPNSARSGDEIEEEERS